jgi:hypothetical protein
MTGGLMNALVLIFALIAGIGEEKRVPWYQRLNEEIAGRTLHNFILTV